MSVRSPSRLASRRRELVAPALRPTIQGGGSAADPVRQARRARRPFRQKQTVAVGRKFRQRALERPGSRDFRRSPLRFRVAAVLFSYEPAAGAGNPAVSHGPGRPAVTTSRFPRHRPRVCPRGQRGRGLLGPRVFIPKSPENRPASSFLLTKRWFSDGGRATYTSPSAAVLHTRRARVRFLASGRCAKARHLQKTLHVTRNPNGARCCCSASPERQGLYLWPG